MPGNKNHQLSRFYVLMGLSIVAWSWGLKSSGPTKTALSTCGRWCWLWLGVHWGPLTSAAGPTPLRPLNLAGAPLRVVTGLQEGESRAACTWALQKDPSSAPQVKTNRRAAQTQEESQRTACWERHGKHCAHLHSTMLKALEPCPLEVFGCTSTLSP